MEVGLGGEGLLREAGGFSQAVEDAAEGLLQWMHWWTVGLKDPSANHSSQIVYTQPCSILLCSSSSRVILNGNAYRTRALVAAARAVFRRWPRFPATESSPCRSSISLSPLPSVKPLAGMRPPSPTPSNAGSPIPASGCRRPWLTPTT